MHLYALFIFNSGGIVFTGASHIPRFVGLIALDNVICMGNETSLSQCTTSEPFSHNCNHDEDVSVSCYGTDHGGMFNVTNVTLPDAGYNVTESGMDVKFIILFIIYSRAAYIQIIIYGRSTSFFILDLL